MVSEKIYIDISIGLTDVGIIDDSNESREVRDLIEMRLRDNVKMNCH